MNVDLGARTRPIKMTRISGGSNVFGVHGSKVDLEPSEEELVDYSSKFPEALDEPKTRPEPPSSYQDDDVLRVYCTEGTPRHISRASSAGDLSGGDKRRQPATIHEQDEVKLASHTATANATPQVWSRCSSPNSLISFCMNGQQVDDAHSVISEFSRQPSGIISPSDLPDSPGQTMPPSPKDRRRIQHHYNGPAEQSKQFQNANHVGHSTQQISYSYHQTLHQGNSQLPQSTHFTPISIEEGKLESTTAIPPLVRPHAENRPMRSYTDSKMVGDPYMLDDSLHNYRTEDTPANLSAATSFSDLSSICPRSDYSTPVPRPRRRKPLTPLQDSSQVLLESPHPSNLYGSLGQTQPMNAASSQQSQNSQQDQQLRGSERSFDDQKSDSSHSKPRTLPRKVRANPPAAEVPFTNGNTNKSMPELNKEAESNQDSDSNSEDEELLRQAINRGRPARSNHSSNKTAAVPGNPIPSTSKPPANTNGDAGDSDSESDNQEIIDELIKAGRPASRNQMAIRKGESLGDTRHRTHQTSGADKLKQDKFKAARSMEDLNTPQKMIKKGCTNFRIREQPLRGAEGGAPKQNIVRAQSMKSNKSLGYDQMHDRRQTKTPDPGDLGERFQTPHTGFHNKPVSKVSPMRSQTQLRDQPSTSFPVKKTHTDVDDPGPKHALLSPLRSSVRQSRQTCVKKTTELTSGDASDNSGEEFPPRPPKPPQFRSVSRPPIEVSPPEVVTSSPELANTSIPDVVPAISCTTDASIIQASEAMVMASPPPPQSEENNNINHDKEQVPPEPPEDCEDITVLFFKFTDSNRSYTRRFLKTSPFQSVVNYLQSKGFPPDKYKIVVAGAFMIKKEVTDKYFDKTLAELKMVPKKTLMVRPR